MQRHGGRSDRVNGPDAWDDRLRIGDTGLMGQVTAIHTYCGHDRIELRFRSILAARAKAGIGQRQLARRLEVAA